MSNFKREMSIPMLPFGHYQTVSISLRAALQPRAETFPFPPFAGTGRSETVRRPVFLWSDFSARAFTLPMVSDTVALHLLCNDPPLDHGSVESRRTMPGAR
ncbi:hypothetical protein SAMN05216328_105121 [Ensifer sp. YR511]|nr:hypothetical protein SAMN05216328_105121 [Ensifer sp. YR511]